VGRYGTRTSVVLISVSVVLLLGACPGNGDGLATIEILEPGDEALFYQGETISLKWQSFGLDAGSVRVEARWPGDAEWLPVSSKEALSGGFDWIPERTGDGVLLRVTGPTEHVVSPTVRLRVLPTPSDFFVSATSMFTLMSDSTVRFGGVCPDNYQPWFPPQLAPADLLPDLEDVTQIATSGHHAMFLKKDGTIWMDLGHGAPLRRR